MSEGKLYFIDTLKGLEMLRTIAWEQGGLFTARNRPPDIIVPLPILIEMFVTKSLLYRDSDRVDLRLVTCNKQEAKRLVYLKTNRYRSSIGSLTLFMEEDDGKPKLLEYIHRSLRINPGINKDDPEQQESVNEFLYAVRNIAGPILVTYRPIITTTDKRIAKFFVVTTEDARRLVYFNKQQLYLQHKKERGR